MENLKKNVHVFSSNSLCCSSSNSGAWTWRSSDCLRQRTTLDVHPAEVEVFRVIFLAWNRQLENSKVPVFSIGRSRRAHGWDRQSQGIRTRRVPESNWSAKDLFKSAWNKSFKIGKSYNLICNIVPNSCCPIRTPFCGSANVPSQQWIAGSTFSWNPSRLELRKMRFEEADLMFSIDRRGVGIIVHDARVELACITPESQQCCGARLPRQM